jgi:hypothetical protein
MSPVPRVCSYTMKRSEAERVYDRAKRAIAEARSRTLSEGRPLPWRDVNAAWVHALYTEVDEWDQRTLAELLQPFEGTD